MIKFPSRTIVDIDRFDSIVLSVLLALGVVTGLILLRGDQVGVQVSDVFPVPDSSDVSTRAGIRLTFDEAMDRPSVERHLLVTPPSQGALSWRGKTLLWRSQSGFLAETRYVVTLMAGARSETGHTVQDDLTWTFHTGRPRILFLNAGENSQIHMVAASGIDVHRLTRSRDGSSVWDYAVSPDGSVIAYGLVRPDGEAVDLWLMNADGSNDRRLLACDGSQCTGVTWSPDGRRLAYERRELNVTLGDVDMGLGPSRVWLFDQNSGLTSPLFQDIQMLGFAPRWSPDGGRLGYFDPRGGVRVVDLGTRTSQLFPNPLGEMGTWSPDGQALVFVDLTFVGERISSRLVRADLGDGTTHNLSDAEIEPSDSSPAWSPAGEWIAFGRKALADGTPTPGQQLWLMRPDGSEAHPLVTAPESHLGSLAWSPDGREIAYLRYQLMQADAHPEIWSVSIEGGVPVKLVDNATLPSWLP